MSINYDLLVKDFIADWERDDDPLVHTFKMAATGLIIPFVYKSIREEILHEKPIPLKGSRRALPYKVINNLTGACWYFMWTIKWLCFIVLIKHSQKIVLTCFFRKSRVIKNQLKLLNPSSEYFINFGLVYDPGLLFDPRFICYPYAVYKKKYPAPYPDQVLNYF